MIHAGRRDITINRQLTKFPRTLSKMSSNIFPILFSLCCLLGLSACHFQPQPLSIDERYTEAQKNIHKLFQQTRVHKKTITYQEALARGIQYNYDYRIKLVNTALEAGQLRIAEFTMFPDLKVTGSLYTRDNDYSTFGVTSAGQATDVLNSTPKTLRSLRMGLTWNLLDFGMGYVRSRQQAERVLIAEEEARKQLQQLAQDLRISYWKAYGAQQLLHEVDRFQRLLKDANRQIEKAIADETIPKEDLLRYQTSLLDGERRVAELHYKLDKAMIDLKHLINLPLNQEIVLAPPPHAITKVQNLDDIDFKKLDAISLVLRPELSSQRYQERIAQLGIKAAIVQIIPGITSNSGWNYNSNKFLINTRWLDQSADLTWGLLNLVSLPTTLNTVDTQIKYEKLKSMALTLAVLTQTRYAYSHYVNAYKEYTISRKQSKNANEMYQLVYHRHLAALTSKQRVILAKMETIISKMNENLALSDLSMALGELYLSIGFDLLPPDINYQPFNEKLKIVDRFFERQGKLDFKNYVNETYLKLFSYRLFPAKIKQIACVKKQVTKQNINEPRLSQNQSAVTFVRTSSSDNSSSAIYTLQLFGSYHLQEVKTLQAKLLQENKRTQLACAIYQNRNWYVLTYGKYTGFHQAEKSKQDIPQHLNLSSPFVRHIKELDWQHCLPGSGNPTVAIQSHPVHDVTKQPHLLAKVEDKHRKIFNMNNRQTLDYYKV